MLFFYMCLGSKNTAIIECALSTATKACSCFVFSKEDKFQIWCMFHFSLGHKSVKL